MEEPSVLDYVKSRLNPYRKKGSELSIRDIFGFEAAAGEIEESRPEHTGEGNLTPSTGVHQPWPWRSMTGWGIAIVAQSLLEPPRSYVEWAVGLYLVSAIMMVWSIFSGELEDSKSQVSPGGEPSLSVNSAMIYIGIPLILLAFLAFGGNRFTSVNLFLWSAAILFSILALWEKQLRKGSGNRLYGWISQFGQGIHIRITSWQILFFAAILVIGFFRFYNLNGVPGEMFSDHAEKLLDVSDILQGDYPIFFTRNTGREAFQMYLTAFIVKFFGTGLTFTSLKLGTILAGLFTLPYIYLLGKEVGNQRVGLIALFLAGIAYWPNVISRVGLRFPLYPLFAAPTLYYLIRGLRYSHRNDFLLAGIAMGLGLHGYSSMRIVPLVIILGVIIYLIHNRQKKDLVNAFSGLVVLTFIALVIFLPLLRYFLEQPEMFNYRLLSRLGTSEVNYPGPVLSIFFDNLWKAWLMPFWKNGNIWVHSVTDRPALSVIPAAAYFFGLLYVFIRYIKYRDWLDLFLLLSIPALMLPSILSLAFPAENPSLNRTGAAYIPIFVIIGLALERFLSGIYRSAQSLSRKWAAIIIGIVFLVISLVQDYSLVFDKYRWQFLNSAWNTSEIGLVIRSFADSVGGKDQAFVVPFPHWVDTRLVGINAGYPQKDYALWPDSFESTTTISGPKLFIIKPEDQEAVRKIQGLYPEGFFEKYNSALAGKEFLIYFIPPLDE